MGRSSEALLKFGEEWAKVVRSSSAPQVSPLLFSPMPGSVFVASSPPTSPLPPVSHTAVSPPLTEAESLAPVQQTTAAKGESVANMSSSAGSIAPVLHKDASEKFLERRKERTYAVPDSW